MKAKNKRILAALLSAAMCLGLLAGCGSPEKSIEKIESMSEGERTEKDWLDLVSAYEELGQKNEAFDAAKRAVTYCGWGEQLHSKYSELMYGTPVPSVEPGTYEGKTRIAFECEQYEEGYFCLCYDFYAVDEVYDFVMMCSDYFDVGEDAYALNELAERHPANMEVVDLNSDEDAAIWLCEPGEHDIAAFVVEDGFVTAMPLFTSYEITGADFSGFGFSHPAGTYAAPLSLSFSGTDGGTVWYTLDGTDPLFNSALGSNLNNGTELTEDELTLPTGKTTVSARCITESGLVSPLIQATYSISRTFDSASTRVAWDDSFEYVVGLGGAFHYYDRTTGERLGSLSDNQTAAISVIYGTVSGKEAYGDNATVGWLAAADVQSTTIYVRESSGRAYVVEYQNGKRTGTRQLSAPKIPEIVGNCWMNYQGETLKLKDDDSVIGTEEVAKKAQLMVPGYALWSDYETLSGSVWTGWEHEYYIKACDPNGDNERILWTTQEDQIILDAMTEDIVFFHCGGKHYILILDTGEVVSNPYLNDGDAVWGYTPDAVYVSGERITVDYDVVAESLS